MVSRSFDVHVCNYNEVDLFSRLMVICLSLNCLFISFARICLFYWIVRTLCKLRKLVFCHVCCKSTLDFTAIHKWHTNWEFELFFYIYRTNSFNFNLLHAQNQRNSKMSKKGSQSCSLYKLNTDAFQLRDTGMRFTFIMQRSDLY